MEALVIYEGGICACGFHESLTGDRANHFTFEDKTCPVCRGAEQYDRIQQAADERANKMLGENPAPGTARIADGRRTFVRRMSPLEVAELTPRRSAAEQAPGQ